MLVALMLALHSPSSYADTYLNGWKALAETDLETAKKELVEKHGKMSYCAMINLETKRDYARWFLDHFSEFETLEQKNAPAYEHLLQQRAKIRSVQPGFQAVTLPEKGAPSTTLSFNDLLQYLHAKNHGDTPQFTEEQVAWAVKALNAKLTASLTQTETGEIRLVFNPEAHPPYDLQLLYENNNHTFHSSLTEEPTFWNSYNVAEVELHHSWNDDDLLVEAGFRLQSMLLASKMPYFCSTGIVFSINPNRIRAPYIQYDELTHYRLNEYQWQSKPVSVSLNEIHYRIGSYGESILFSASDYPHVIAIDHVGEGIKIKRAVIWRQQPAVLYRDQTSRELQVLTIHNQRFPASEMETQLPDYIPPEMR